MLLAGQHLELDGQRRRQAHVEAAGLGAAHRRPRAVRGQLEERRAAGELTPPVGRHLLQRRAVQPPALPDGVVGVLHRQFA